MRILPEEKWIDFSHQIILHGRARCTARKPDCATCPLDRICFAADKTSVNPGAPATEKSQERERPARGN